MQKHKPDVRYREASSFSCKLPSFKVPPLVEKDASHWWIEEKRGRRFAVDCCYSFRCRYESFKCCSRQHVEEVLAVIVGYIDVGISRIRLTALVEVTSGIIATCVVILRDKRTKHLEDLCSVINC